MVENNNDEENLNLIAKDITYEKLIKLDETKYEIILRYQPSIQTIIKITKDCLANFEKNILKNYSLFICVDKVCPLKDNKIFESKEFEEIFDKFKKEFLEFKSNSELICKNNQDESKNDTLKNRLEFLKFFIKILTEIKQYNILKEILMDHIYLNPELKRQFIKQFIDEFKGKEEYLFNKEEIKFYEFLILEFNYLEDSLEYKSTKIENDNFNYEIKLNKEIENIQYLNEFIGSFSKQKDKEVIKDMEIFIFNFFNSTNNLNYLFKNCNAYLNDPQMMNSNIIDLYKYIISNSEKNCILKLNSLFSLSKKIIFKFAISFNDKKEDLYFYGNTRINEINNYLNMNFKDFKNNDDEYFMIEYKDENDNKYFAFDEFDSNKTINELIKNGKKLEIKKESFDKAKLLDSNNNLTEKFNSILTDWFKIYSKQKDIMNRNQLANFFNKVYGKNKQHFNKESMKIYHFLNYNSKSLERITLNEFKAFYKKACKNKFNDVITNIKNMNLTPNLTRKIQEINNNKLPRYYLSNKVDEFKESYLWKLLTDNFTNSLKEEIFNFLSFLCVNEELYNNVLNDFNNKDNMKFCQKNDHYIEKLNNLYIIESIIEDVEIHNNKDYISDNQKEIILYENIHPQKSNPFEDEKCFEKKNQFFINFIKNSYSDLVLYTSLILEKLNNYKEETDTNNDNNNNIIIHSCIKCLDIINIIYNSYHNINAKIVNNNNIINIKYKELRNIIVKNELSNNINDKTIYKEIIIQIIKCVDKFCDKLDYKNKDENNATISILKQNCYILLFSLLYTNREIFEIINKNKEINQLFDKVLRDLYLFDDNKKDFEFYFTYIFEQIEDKISDEFLSYLIDLLFEILQEYIKSNKTKIENEFISYHLKLLLNYCSKKENLKKKLKDEFEKIFEQYNNFINNKNSENINGEIFKFIIQELLSKTLDEIDDELFNNELKNITQGEKTFDNNIDNCSFDESIQKLKSNEEKKISKEKEKYNYIEKLLKEDDNIS